MADTVKIDEGWMEAALKMRRVTVDGRRMVQLEGKMFSIILTSAQARDLAVTLLRMR